MPNSKIGRAAFIDVETTGLNPLRDEIIELGLTVFMFRRDTGEILDVPYMYTSLRQPSKRVPRSATAIHGITDEMVKGRRIEEEKVRIELESSEFLVAHNANFDYAFVVRLFPWTASMVWMCSMRQIDWVRDGYPSRGLQFLIRTHHLEVFECHRAGADCMAGVRLLGCQNKHGQFYLRELLDHLPRNLQDTAGK
ncbi:MAG: exonuclease domain-containing protein [Thermaerobacter sp.]|nr:exonuclease domain-containing protein [Thermaerobacter sp.]